MHFCTQNAFWSQKVIFGAKIHFLGSDRARRRKGLGVCEFVRVPKGTFCSKSHFAPKNHFLRQKCILGPKCTFGPKKWFWSQKCVFSDFGPKWLHLSFVLKVFGAKCKKGGFYVKFSKNVQMCEKRFPTTHNSENFAEFPQNSHFWHVGFYYSGAEKPVTTLPPFRRGAFWSPKCIFGPQNAFWAPKCFFGSRNAFWGPFCPLAADAYETNGFCIGF